MEGAKQAYAKILQKNDSTLENTAKKESANDLSAKICMKWPIASTLHPSWQPARNQVKTKGFHVDDRLKGNWHRVYHWVAQNEARINADIQNDQ